MVVFTLLQCKKGANIKKKNHCVNIFHCEILFFTKNHCSIKRLIEKVS